ncbi:MAG: diguanylate cyclase [Actinobacteria bacterium]|nr:diguanylate cyclase [Actinomycetota bacterium]MCG2802634.1 diguanylate cyclase [Cellulomonas sp.]
MSTPTPLDLLAIAASCLVLEQLLELFLRPRGVLRGPLSFALGGAAVWTLAATAVDIGGLSTSGVLVLAAVQMVSSWAVVLGGTWMALIISYRGHLVDPYLLALACTPAVAMVGLLATQPTRPLVVTRIVGTAAGSVIQWGPAFWAFTLAAGALVGVICALAVGATVATVRGQRRAMVIVMLLVAPAGVSWAFFVADPVSGRWSLVPPLLLSLALLIWAHLHHRLPGLAHLPITAVRVMREVQSGVVVLTPELIVLETNAAARAMLCASTCLQEDDLVGRPWREIVDPVLAILPGGGRTLTATTERGRVLELMVEDVGGDGTLPALVVAASDVTELSELRAHLADQATRDPMTGARNRRFLDARLPSFVAAVDRNHDMSVLMLDIDLFKLVNDLHGHAMGDRVVIAIAEEAAAALPPGGELVRTGGDEFLLLLPDTDEVAAAQTGDLVRRRCAQLQFATHGPPVRVTVSAGVAHCLPGMSADDLLSAVDRALYRAKDAGRDMTHA